MVKRTLKLYKDSFTGLSPEIWWLALITFINRAGTMIIPFLSLYLTKDLEFSLPQVGWIMSAFGVGSFLGSWIGGKLTDKIGYYKVMFWSLLLTGFLFIGLQYITTFWGFVAGIVIIMTIADTFRPAMFVSLNAYSKPENQTRSLTLIRLAINLGFSFGPFIGGLIIAGLSYKGLFWIDGLTCILAIVIFKMVLKNKALVRKEKEVEEISVNSSIFNDRPYWIFLVIVFLMSFAFMQLFSTMPLYYVDVYSLTEVEIGLLMSMNGIIIFLTEMPIIHKLEESSINRIQIIFWSLILFAASFFVLNISIGISIIIISMIIITVAEMLAFPFTNAFAMTRAVKGKEGLYMALYTMAFSLAHIFSAKTGMEVIDRFGFDANWYLMGVLSLIAAALSVWLKRVLK
ncbi:MAG: MFS transporter [Flavobacteriaceae bacterium]|nr:MFS transporter [Flavobacteriaceae bacterium]